MRLYDFQDNIDADSDLEGIGVDCEHCTIAVRHTPTGTKWRVGAGAVLDHDWQVLRAVLCGETDPTPLDYVTRIVGYWSRVSNWNASAVGQLKDRRANVGNYRINEQDKWLEQEQASVGAA